MACRFEYKGKSYTQDELVGALRNMSMDDAAKFVPGVSHIPDMPFGYGNWHELALKRAVRDAVERGKTRISWTPGDAQAARYDLSKQISKIEFKRSGLSGFDRLDQIEGMSGGTLVAYDHNGRKVIEKHVHDDKQIPDLIGKEAAEKLLAQKPTRKEVAGTAQSHRTLEGLDLKVGGEGMRKFYDEKLVNSANKMFKKHGVKVQRGDLGPEATKGAGALSGSDVGRIMHGQPGWEDMPMPGTTEGERRYGTWFRDLSHERRERLFNEARKKSKSGGQPVWYFDIPESLAAEARKGFHYKRGGRVPRRWLGGPVRRAMGGDVYDEVAPEDAPAPLSEAEEAAIARESAAARLRGGVQSEARRGSTMGAAEGAELAAGFAPGSGIADVMGVYPDFKGGHHPSFGENIKQGEYGTAALQGLGLAGDMMMAVPPLIPLAELAKAPRALSRSARAAKELTAAKAMEEAKVLPEAAEAARGVEAAPEMPAVPREDLPTPEAPAPVTQMAPPAPPEHIEALTVNDILHPEAPAQKPRSRNVEQIAEELRDRGSEALRQLGVDAGKIEKPDPRTDEILSHAIASEIQAAIGRGGKTATNWYTSAIDEAMQHAATIHPELKDNPHQKMGFTAALAVTSQGEAVQSNVRLAEQVYRTFKETGRFPTNVKAKNGPAMNSNFRKLNDLLDAMGPDGTREFLHKEFTVKELKQMGYDVGGENMQTKVYGSAILGPKIGQGFYQNLNGNYNPVTMDLWFMRAWGRLTGTLVGRDFQKPMERLHKAMAGERYNYIPGDPDELADAAREIVKRHEKDFKENRPLYDSKEKQKSELTYAAERFLKNYSGVNEQPNSGAHRQWMRDRVNRAREILKERGHNVTNADLQAIWWYPEKDLYAKLGGRPSEKINTDYASAFRELAERAGSGEQAAAVRPVERAVGSGANNDAGTVKGRSKGRSKGNGPPEVERARGGATRHALRVAYGLRRAT